MTHTPRLLPRPHHFPDVASRVPGLGSSKWQEGRVARGKSVVWHTSLLLTLHRWNLVTQQHQTARDTGGHCRLVCSAGRHGQQSLPFWIPNLCFILIPELLPLLQRRTPKVPAPNNVQFSPLDAPAARHGLGTYEPKSQGVCLTFPSQPTDRKVQYKVP